MSKIISRTLVTPHSHACIGLSTDCFSPPTCIRAFEKSIWKEADTLPPFNLCPTCTQTPDTGDISCGNSSGLQRTPVNKTESYHSISINILINYNGFRRGGVSKVSHWFTFLLETFAKTPNISVSKGWKYCTDLISRIDSLETGWTMLLGSPLDCHPDNES